MLAPSPNAPTSSRRSASKRRPSRASHAADQSFNAHSPKAGDEGKGSEAAAMDISEFSGLDNMLKADNDGFGDDEDDGFLMAD